MNLVMNNLSTNEQNAMGRLFQSVEQPERHQDNGQSADFLPGTVLIAKAAIGVDMIWIVGLNY